MNAIILAAGLGSRFKSVTEQESKTLLDVDGMPGMEYTLQFLIRNKIMDITIVTGHMANRFDYLKDKYGVRLVYNSKYGIYNNIYSMYQALDCFGDTLVIDGDVVVIDDIPLPLDSSMYYLIQRSQTGIEWVPTVDNSGVVTEMTCTDAPLPSLLGISYWTEHDAMLIKAAYADYLSETVLLDVKMYWDTIPTTLYDQLSVRTELVSADAACEMDNVEEYQYLCQLVASKKAFS